MTRNKDVYLPVRQTVVHSLKTDPKYLNAIGRGEKTFEVRKDDRGFKVGDWLVLREYDQRTKTYGPRWIGCKITYILDATAGFGLIRGWCVLGIQLPANHCWPPDGR